jgi:1-acyl-sn-glycerol-3-phosphate acyltransferase
MAAPTTTRAAHGLVGNASELEEREVHDWDVTRGPRKEGAVGRMRMVLPASTRVITNIVGSTMFGGGYAIGKVGQALGAGKAVDSPAFHAGVMSWLWSNGIVPKVVFEQTGAAGKAEDTRLTPFIISNHTSYLDGLILAACLGYPRVVAMSGSRKVPVVGKMMEEMECVFVDRSSSDSRKATLDAMTSHAADWMPGSRPMLVFPEGTTSNGEVLLPFKKGAFTAGVPVRPVILVYTGQWDPASTSYKATDHGPERISDKEWLAQFAGNWVHSVHVRVLPPYSPSEEERRDADLFASNCRAHMAAELSRVRQEVEDASWKQAAGRERGGLGYKFGDESRVAARRTMKVVRSSSCASRTSGRDPRS